MTSHGRNQNFVSSYQSAFQIERGWIYHAGTNDQPRQESKIVNSDQSAAPQEGMTPAQKSTGAIHF